MSDILIIGGGIIGMLTARELQLAGMQVTIVEQGQAGQESSWAGGGIISPLYPWRYADAVTELARWSQQHYPDLIAEMNAETGLDAELQPSGLLIMDEQVEDALAWAARHDINLQHVDSKAVLEIEPQLSPILAAQQQALWMPDVAQVRNPRLVKVTRQYLRQKGVRFLEQTRVDDFVCEAGQIKGVQTDKGVLAADRVMLAGGAWSANLLKKLDIFIDVMPVKGQMILFRTTPGTVGRITLSEDRYVIPRKDGRVLVGSSIEHSGFDKSLKTAVRQELVSEAARIIPVLAEAEVEHHWAGLRPGSPQGIPYICAVPSVAGLYLNSGHFRNGVVLGPASARLMADLMLDRPGFMDTTVFELAASH